MATCRALPIAQRRRITFEYVMLAGVNDSLADAARLVTLLHGIRAKVNLIPFNPFPGTPASRRRRPRSSTRFQQRLLRCRHHRHRPRHARPRHPGRVRPTCGTHQSEAGARTPRTSGAQSPSPG